jgi:hypothetical protein
MTMDAKEAKVHFANAKEAKAGALLRPPQDTIAKGARAAPGVTSEVFCFVYYCCFSRILAA